jgi:cytidine deaminase
MFEAALRARGHAHSPYSGAKVGAAVRDADGRISVGCNVENSSYGGTTCAEQVAMHAAIANHGALELREVVVVTDASPPWSPCGICRQVMTEFAAPATDVTVHLFNLEGEHKAYTLAQLLPDAFTPAHLGKGAVSGAGKR